MIRLAEEEHAHQLALNHKQGQSDPIPPLARTEASRPSYNSTFVGLNGYRQAIEFLTALSYTWSPDPPYWQSFNASLINQLIYGTPTAFPYVLDIAKFPSRHFIDWVRNLGAGGVVCAPRFIRDTLASGSESNIKLLQGLYNIVATGSTLDESTAALIEKYKLNFRNVFGSTELMAVLITSQAPYTHLRPLPDPSPLVHPISDTDTDGSRQVQFWFSPSTSRRIAHLRVKGTVPLKFEPFPGDGPHNGEPAVKLDDIFKEITTGSQISYIHLGRADDLIKLAGNGGWDINASTYETELISAITSYVSRQPKEEGRWTVEGVQLFGSNRPCTSLVIQLCPVDHDQHEIGQDLLECLSNLVKLVNNKLELEPNRRVHPQKRMLVVTSHGKAYGSGAGSFGEDIPRLLVTHKHTLQRWKNVEAFTSWMDGLDYSEP
ncbi:hypothetical protein OPQ81_007405 [Rhizoctonia solani]|nr:hypothetical protein OPQ81_007405 [Rhizoctonia solani]